MKKSIFNYYAIAFLAVMGFLSTDNPDKGLALGLIHYLFFILIVTALFFFSFRTAFYSAGDPLTKKQIKKFTHIVIVSRVRGIPTEDGSIFVIKLVDETLCFLKEPQLLVPGKTYMLNHKNEWQDIPQYDSTNRVRSVSK